MKKSFPWSNFFLLFFSPFLFSAPFHKIIIDGNLSDFSNDELIYEDKNDSLWLSPTEGDNEIQALYLTWDDKNLYIGIEGKVTDNGILCFIDINPEQKLGFNDLTRIPSWNRKICFENNYIDFFYGSWNQNDGWFYEIISDYAVRDITSQISRRSNRNSPKPGFELSIPFDTLYKQAEGKVEKNAKIKIFVTLVTGDIAYDKNIGVNYGYIGGDILPNDAKVKLLQPTTIYNLIEKTIDENSDSLPDDKLQQKPLHITNVYFSNKIFHPPVEGTFFSFTLSKPSIVNLKIFNTAGKLVKHHINNHTVNFQTDTETITYFWNGRDENGNPLPSGIYIFNLLVETANEKKTINKPVAILR